MERLPGESEKVYEPREKRKRKKIRESEICKRIKMISNEIIFEICSFSLNPALRLVSREMQAQWDEQLKLRTMSLVKKEPWLNPLLQEDASIVDNFKNVVKKLYAVAKSHSFNQPVPKDGKNLFNWFLENYLEMGINKQLLNWGWEPLPDNISEQTYLRDIEISNQPLPSIDWVVNCIDLELLNLRKASLTELPNKIHQCTKIRFLTLSNNKFKYFPKNILKLKNLAVLVLTKNRISSIPIKIWDMPELRCINLSKNDLTVLPPIATNQCKVDSLKLADNPLTYLPEGIEKLRHLSWLYLNGTDIAMLPDEIRLMPNLKLIDLRNTPFAQNLNQEELYKIPPNCKIVTK